MKTLRTDRSPWSLLMLALLAGSLATVVGCQSAPEDDTIADEPTATENGGDELVIRPTCRSSADCRPVDVCTTELGACNRPPGCKPGTICPAVCHGICVPRRPPIPTPPPPAASTCQSDSDCRTFSNTCTGCDCQALGVGEKPPTCDGPGVQCLVDPCRAKQAFCSPLGRCQLRPRLGTPL